MKDKIKYLFFAALLMSLSIYGQFNQQNNEITKRFFPDPDIEINLNIDETQKAQFKNIYFMKDNKDNGKYFKYA